MQNAIKRILIPIDFSLDAANALWHADRFAHLHEADLYFLNVVPVENQMGVSISASEAGYTQADTGEAATELRSFVRSILKRSIPDDHFLVANGPVVERIVDIAEQNKIDLLVMGTRGSGRTSPAWVGSTTADLLERAPCHLLVVPEKANRSELNKVLCATDLKESDPYRIWKAANILKAFAPKISCVHVHSAHNGTFHISMDELKSFLTVTVPTIDISFYEIVGITAWDSLNDFCMHNHTDLLVVFKPLDGLLKTLLHRSVSRSLLLQTTVPLMVLR